MPASIHVLLGYAPLAPAFDTLVDDARGVLFCARHVSFMRASVFFSPQTAQLRKASSFQAPTGDPHPL